MNTRHILDIFLSGFLLVSCADTTEVERYLDAADVHLEDNPEMALETLESINREMLTTRKVRARFALLYTMALDKNYIDVASDSIIAPAVKYYENHGTAKEKLLTYYYNGVVSLNAGDMERAMESYVEAEQYVKDCRDYGIIARLYTAKMSLYQYSYDFESALSQEEVASSYFLKSKDTLQYIATLNDMASLHMQLGQYIKAYEHLDIVKSHWQYLNEYNKSRYFSNMLYLSQIDTVISTDSILNEYISEISSPQYINWINISNAYLEISDFDAALDSILKYRDSGGCLNAAYYWTLALVYEGLNDYENSITAFKEYFSITGKENVNILESDTKYVEDKYLAELKSVKQTLYIVVVTLSLIVFILLFIILFQRMRKIKEEKRIQKIKFDEERRTIVGEKEQVEAKCVLLREEKEETERMHASLKAEIEQLKKIRKDKSIDKDILASVEQRLNVLNMFILAELSDSFEKIAYTELGKLMENRDDFLESTKKTFMISHPKFITYLRKRNLTEWEIGCCCLYCIGFNGTEISEYLNRKAIYNVNSTIRQKLDIPKGGTQIDVFLKQKLQEFHT